MGLKLFLLRNWRRLTGRTPYPLNEDLSGLRSNWDRMGKHDPCYAICTQPGKENKQWDQAEFFATGRKEITSALQQARTLAPELKRRRALDFGCGIGRLSQALAAEFARVDGVDISDEMLRQARALAGAGKDLHFHKISGTTLPFEDQSFDFVYSRLVLQHMKSALALQYVREFARVLAPGGLALFQAPAHNLVLATDSISCPHEFAGRAAFMEMHGHPRAQVEAAIAAAGGRVLEVRQDDSAGPAWESLVYAVTR